jgi:hypothetical protein
VWVLCVNLPFPFFSSPSLFLIHTSSPFSPFRAGCLLRPPSPPTTSSPHAGELLRRARPHMHPSSFFIGFRLSAGSIPRPPLSDYSKSTGSNRTKRNVRTESAKRRCSCTTPSTTGWWTEEADCEANELANVHKRAGWNDEGDCEGDFTDTVVTRFCFFIFYRWKIR